MDLGHDLSLAMAHAADYAGELSFGRRRYSRQLDGVDIAVVGIPFDAGTVNRPGARFGRLPAITVEQIRDHVGARSAYVTFDIDFIDPAYAPGTGTPVCGGPTTHQARSLLHGLAGLNIVGADLVEVAPPYDPSGVTALAGATIAFDLLSLMASWPESRTD